MADAGEPAPAEESLALLEAGGEGAVLPSKGPPELRIMLLGLWLMSCAGLQYSFSTYSPVVVANLRLTQSQLGIMALGKVRRPGRPGHWVLTDSRPAHVSIQDIGAYLAVFQVRWSRAAQGGRPLLCVAQAHARPLSLQGVFYDRAGGRATLVAGVRTPRRALRARARARGLSVPPLSRLAATPPTD